MITSQLEERLLSTAEFDEELITENVCPDLCEILGEYIDKAGITRSELIRGLDLDRTYGYQLLNGTRNPTRKHLIQIGLFLRLDVDSLQRLLKTGRKKPLYVRDMFDARVYFAVGHKMSFKEALEFIWGE